MQSMWCVIIAFKTKTQSKFIYNCFNLFEKLNFILMHEFFHFIGFNCGTVIISNSELLKDFTAILLSLLIIKPSEMYH